MKTIGLIGGMSWESSLVYYRDLNLGMTERLGGLSSPKLVLSTVDFAELTDLEEHERWDQIGELLADAARGVERAGADFLLLCTTTFHKAVDAVEAAVDIPILNLGEVVADAIDRAGITKVAMLGTKVAMTDPVFTGVFRRRGIEMIAPDPAHHDWINDAIYEELVHGHVLDRTRKRMVGVIDEVWDAGAQGVLLGCTEIELLIKESDSNLPVFPCTTLHVQAALDLALADD